MVPTVRGPDSLEAIVQLRLHRDITQWANQHPLKNLVTFPATFHVPSHINKVSGLSGVIQEEDNMSSVAQCVILTSVRALLNTTSQV